MTDEQATGGFTFFAPTAAQQAPHVRSTGREIDQHDLGRAKRYEFICHELREYGFGACDTGCASGAAQ